MTNNRPLKKLWEIGTFIRWITYHKRDLLPSHIDWCVTLLRSNNIQDKLNLVELQYLPKEIIWDEKIVKENDILFCMSNGSKDLVWKNILLPELKDYSFWAFCSIFRPNNSESSMYIKYFLRSSFYKEYIYWLSRWIGINNLRNNDLELLEIPLPPLATQKAIVAKLDETFAQIDEAITTTQANIERTDEFTKSVLDKVFEEGEWEKMKMWDLIEKKDLWLVKWQIDQGLNKRYKYLKMNNISLWWKINLNKLINVDLDENEVMRFKLNYWDFLFNTRNSFELVGKSCVFDIHVDDVYLYNNNILRLRFKESVSPFFINYSFLTNSQKKQLETMKSWTTNVSAIYYKDLKDLEIPLPPLDKQIEIVEYIDEVFAETSQLKNQYQNKLIELKELKASILQSAFEGKLV